MNTPRSTPRGRRRLAAAALLAIIAAKPAAARKPAEDPVPVAILVYDTQRPDVCFSEVFLSLVATETTAIIEPRLTPLLLPSPALNEAPIALMTGEGFFELTAPQRTALRDWLANGGFLIASSGCSNHEWALSFKHEMDEIFHDAPEPRLTPLPPTHDVFNTIYQIRKLQRTAPPRAADADLPEPPPTIIDASPLEGLTLNDRLCVVFTPDGLNDTVSFGGACCCCGTGEVIQSRQMMANLVAYALAQRATQPPPPAQPQNPQPPGTIEP
ncbi:MAG: DUF4159 domain-containing protein [Phycisphaerales bacterium]